ncbi:MAG: hypothetical protein PVH61_42290 [Candidatus Aminicenantes bacterium]
MKHLLFFLVIASFFVSCENSKLQTIEGKLDSVEAMFTLKTDNDIEYSVTCKNEKLLGELYDLAQSENDYVRVKGVIIDDGKGNKSIEITELPVVIKKKVISKKNEIPVEERKPKFTFKGFYLSMDFNEAKTRLLEITKKVYTKNELDIDAIDCKDNAFLRMVLLLKKEGEGFKIDTENIFSTGVAIIGGKNNKLTYLYFAGFFVDRLFNSEDLSPIEFATEFAKNYGIPEMEPFSVFRLEKNYQGWKYKTNDGIEVKIESDKTIEMRIAKILNFD